MQTVEALSYKQLTNLAHNSVAEPHLGSVFGRWYHYAAMSSITGKNISTAGQNQTMG